MGRKGEGVPLEIAADSRTVSQAKLEEGSALDTYHVVLYIHLLALFAAAAEPST
jgi:hypothetical protein